MITPQLQGWAQSKGYRLVHGQKEEQDVVACPVDGYVFSIGTEIDNTKSSTIWMLFGAIGAAVASAGMRNYTIRLAVDHQSWDKQVLKDLKQALKGIAAPGYVKGFLSLALKKNAHNDDTYDSGEFAMHTSAAILAEKGVRAPDTCFCCNTTGCDTHATPQKGALACLLPAHETCVQQFQQKAADRMVKTYGKASVIKGLPWLLLGFLISLIIPFLLPLIEVYGSLISMIFFALIPIITFSFYQSHGGKMNAVPFLLVFLLTGIAICGLVIWGDYRYICDELGEMSFAMYLLDLTYDIEYTVVLGVELLISWVAGLVGILIGWFSSRKKFKRSLERIEAMGAAPVENGTVVAQATAAGPRAEPAMRAAIDEPQLGIGLEE